MKNLKKIAMLFVATALFIGCNNDDDSSTPSNVTVDFKFTHNFDGTSIENADYETTSYTNANGESLMLSKLVYLISDVTFTAADGTVYTGGDYNLVNARTGSGIDFTPNIELPKGDYTVSLTFGFNDEDNDAAGGYEDLNTADGGWGVPDPLGGGYHYMRMEGTYVNSIGATENFQYHTIRANSHTTLPPGPGTLDELTDTSFVVSLGTVSVGSTTSVEVQMDVAEWFVNPNTWDLNMWFTVLMPNYEAQLDMNENGSAGVFSLGTVVTED
ncbi:MAG: hypothetical protein Aureis2KO_01950 [Aureisphaera sp.]